MYESREEPYRFIHGLALADTSDIMRSRFILIFLLCLWTSGVLLFPSVTLADKWYADPQFNAASAKGKPCTCFCTSNNGVVPGGKGKVAPAACEAACTANDQKVAVCAPTLAEYPSNNRLCFTKTQCDTAQSGKAGEWDDKKQPPECPTGMHYCFPLAAKVETKLSVQIGGLSSVGDLSVYVNALYLWMLGVGVIIAIVMVMIGGFQYVLSAGGIKAGEGKKRISSAVIGLLMLFSIALIVGVVNPQLLKMKVPRLSLVRSLDVSVGQTCEDFEKENIVTKEDGTEFSSNPSNNPFGHPEKWCGAMGVVSGSKDKNKDTIAGQTCQYSTCPAGDSYYRQDCVGQGTKAQCLRCGDIIDKNIDKNGIKPSSSTCAKLSKGTFKSAKDGTDVIETCEWTQDGDFTDGIGAITANTPGSCVFVQITCRDIKTCFDYGIKGVAQNENPDQDGPLAELDLNPNGGGDLDGGIQCVFGCSTASLKTICEDNPCNVPAGCGISPTNGGCFSKLAL